MARLQFLSAFVAACLFGNAVVAEPWLITKYYEMSTETVITGVTEDSRTRSELAFTRTLTVEPTVTDPAASATQTTVDKYQKEVTRVNVILEPSQGSIVSYTPGGSINPGYFYIPLTYTYPKTCSNSSTITTEGRLYAPLDVRDQLTPTFMTTQTSTHTYSYINVDPDTVTSTKAYLDPTDLPSEVLKSVRATNTPYDIKYCGTRGSGGSSSGSGSDRYASCSKYAWLMNGSKIGGGYCCSDGCHHTWGLEPWSLAVVIIFSWLGFFLILGLIESAVKFKHLMVGKAASRGLPKTFCLLLPLLSCILLVFTKKGFVAKSPEEQAVLTKQWNDMSFGRKFKLWLRYGFSFGYPPMLGAPPGVNHGIYQGGPQAQTQQVMHNPVPGTQPMQYPISATQPTQEPLPPPPFPSEYRNEPPGYSAGSGLPGQVTQYPSSELPGEAAQYRGSELPGNSPANQQPSEMDNVNYK